jgi:hypothetical protein
MVTMDNINATLVPKPAGALFALPMAFVAVRFRRRLA